MHAACGYVVERKDMMPTPTIHDIIGEVPQNLQAMVEKLAEELVSSQKIAFAIHNKFVQQ